MDIDVNGIENSLRSKESIYTLKKNTGGRADVWNHFYHIYVSDKDGSHRVPGISACVRCKKKYKIGNEKSPFGTSNLASHLKTCKPSASADSDITKIMKKKAVLSDADRQRVRNAEVGYCVDGFHAFRSVEHSGFLAILQLFVNLGARYGTFDVTDVLLKSQQVSRDAMVMVRHVKEKVRDILSSAIGNECIALTTDIYTDDYRKLAYMDVHCFYVDEMYSIRHFALAVRHFGTASHTAENICSLLLNVLSEYGINLDNTPVTTDHGSNVVAALKNRIRVDCFAHRLHTVVSTAWRESVLLSDTAAKYESAVSALCSYVKKASGIQEALPCTIKYGGETRPWLSMYNTAYSISQSYQTLLSVMTGRNRLLLVTDVDAEVNEQLLVVLGNLKQVFEVLQRNSSPKLQLVVPSYYKLMRDFSAHPNDSECVRTFKSQLREYTDSKFYSSIKALHLVACFLDPDFRDMKFVPEVTTKERIFKRDLQSDLDKWVLAEMELVSNTENEELASNGIAEPATKSFKVCSDIFADFRSTSTFSAGASVIKHQQTNLGELQKYKVMAVVGIPYESKDPLKFWKAVASDFPVLSQVAKRVFCVCATSAQSERDFSSVGLTLTQLRSRLSPVKVEAIQILRSAQISGILSLEFVLRD